MKAIVVEKPGIPEVLSIRELPRPQPRSGWVLIRVKAFGLNRSELFTRQGHSGSSVRFPRVLGIECVGIIEDPSDTGFETGQTVAAVMGGMGRKYDGGYAEYTAVLAQHVIPLKTTLSWETLAAIPETFLTAWGSLVEAMDVQTGQTLLVRGGTSSLGMAATSIAKDMGLTVIATTRNKTKMEALRENGADHIIIDSGKIEPELKRFFPGGVDHVLELVGTATLLDSLRTVTPKGILCNSGILGNSWTLENFEPLAAIPSTVKLTTYGSETITASSATEALQRIVDKVALGRYRVNLDQVFQFGEIVEAHHYMENNQAKGKLVVMVD